MLTLLVAVALGAQGAPSAMVTTTVKKTAPDHATAQRLLEPLREALRGEGFTVLTPAEAQARAPTTHAADCGRNRACLSLFAGALAVDWLVTVETDAVERDLAVSIQALSPQTEERPEMSFITVVNAPDLELRVRAFAPKLAAIVRRTGGFSAPEPLAVVPPPPVSPPLAAAEPEPVPAPAAARPVNGAAIGAGVAGVAFAVAGGVLLMDARSIHADLTRSPEGVDSYPPEVWEPKVARGKLNQTLGLVALGVGAAAGVTSVVLFTQGGPAEPAGSVSVAAAPNGIVLTGRF